jgi:hypothetical protein
MEPLNKTGPALYTEIVFVKVKREVFPPAGAAPKKPQ